MKLNVFLFEDSKDDVSKIIGLLENKYNVMHSDSFAQSKQKLKEQKFDLAVLDIFINGEDEGIQLADYILTDLDYELPFFFLTSTQSKLVFEKAKLTNPVSYLLKPFNPLELQFTIDLAIEKEYKQPNSISADEKSVVINKDFFFIKKHGYLAKVKQEDIRYVEVEGNYCTIMAEDERFLIRLSLNKTKDQYLSEKFMQISRKCIVNTRYIDKIYMNENLILLETDEKLTIGESYKKSITESMNVL